MKLKETRILDAEAVRYACIANQYCTRCDCEEYDRILNDAAESSRKPGGITTDDLARHRLCAVPPHRLPLHRSLSRRPPRTPDHPPGILWYLYTKTFLRFIAFLCVLPYHGSNEIQ